MKQSAKRVSRSIFWTVFAMLLLPGLVNAATIADWDDDGVTDAVEQSMGTDPYSPMVSSKYSPRALNLGKISDAGVAMPVTQDIIRFNAPSTVEFWLMPYTDGEKTDSIFVNGTSADVFNYNDGELLIQLVKATDSTVKFVVKQGGAQVAEGAEFSAEPSALNWQHIALLTEGDGQFLFYQNDMKNTAASWDSSVTATADGAVVLGKGFNQAFLDEFRIFTCKRTAAQLLKNTSVMCTTSEDALTAYYRFDDGGKSVEDFAHLPNFANLAGLYTEDDETAVKEAFKYRLAMPEFADANGDGHADWLTAQACATQDLLTTADGDGDGIVNDLADNTLDDVKFYAIVRNVDASCLETKTALGDDQYFADGAFTATYKASALYIKAGAESGELATTAEAGDLTFTQHRLAKSFAEPEANYYDGLDNDGDGVVDDSAIALAIAPVSGESFTDTDEDRLDDSWEFYYFGNLTADRTTDFDGDGCLDGDEYDLGLNPVEPNTTTRFLYATLTTGEYVKVEQTADGKFIYDGNEVEVTDASQLLGKTDGEIDCDGDTISNADERSATYGYVTDPTKLDTDGDTYADNEEIFTMSTDPTDPNSPTIYADEDGDGIDDGWETTYFGDLTTADATTDYDGDGVLDIQEYKTGTDPKETISENRSFWTYVNGEYTHVKQEYDNTGMPHIYLYESSTEVTGDVDDLEAILDTEDGDLDYDGDYLANAFENDLGTNILMADSDGDGLDDWEESMMGTDPNSAKDPWRNRSLDLISEEHQVSVLSYDEETDSLIEVETMVPARSKACAVVEDFNDMIYDLSNWSAEFWFCLNDDSALTGTLLEKTADKAKAQQDFKLEVQSGKLVLTLADNYSKSKNKSFKLENYELKTGVWTHVAFSVEKKSDSQYQVFMMAFDETLDKPVTSAFLPTTGRIVTSQSQKGDLLIGDATGSLSMEMDELRIWNKVVSQEDFVLNRDIFLAAETANLAAYFQFNQTTADGSGVAAVTYAARSELSGQLADASSAMASAKAYYEELLAESESSSSSDSSSSSSTDEEKQALENAKNYYEYTKSQYNTILAKYEAEMATDGMVAVFRNGACLSLVDPEAYQDGDSDDDDIADWWEYTYFNNLTSADSTTDADSDELSDYYEYLLRGQDADPTDPHSLEGGLVSDGDVDSDGDGLTNAEEMDYDTDPTNADTDDDGISDKIEVAVSSAPLHPASVVVDKATGKLVTKTWSQLQYNDLYGYRATSALARSLDLRELSADYLVLPKPDRFAVGSYTAGRHNITKSGDFTLEMWVKLTDGTESGSLFEFKSADTTWSWKLYLKDGRPVAEICNNDQAIAVVGGDYDVDSTRSAPQLLADEWTYVALNWESKAKTLALRLDKLAYIGSLPVSYEVDFGSEAEYARIQKINGVALDEIRFWGETRSDEQIEYWADRIIPSPLKAAASYCLVSDGNGGYKEERFMTRDYELRAYYRFDDGGQDVEDFAHFRDEDYVLDDLGACTFGVEKGAKNIAGVDDVDGDGIADWWINVWGVNSFYNGLHNYPYRSLYNMPGAQLTKSGTASWIDMLMWNDSSIEGLYGYTFGVGYTSLGGDDYYSVTYKNYVPVSIEHDLIYAQINTGAPEGAFLTDNYQLSCDMAYVTMHKYINLDNTPTTAYLNTYLNHGATVTGVIVNQHLLEGYGSETNIAQYLKAGRNQIVVVWARSVYDTVEVTIGENTTYNHNLYYGTIDVDLTVDDKPVIVKGHDYGYDPRALWYYRATTADYSVGSMETSNGNRGTDENGYTLNGSIVSTTLDAYAFNYGAKQDADNDGLELPSEYLLGTNPLSRDSDNNGISDNKEDYDGDGLINEIELNTLFSSALLQDTDNDGVTDSRERASASDPISWNSPVNYRYLKVDGAEDSYLELPLQSRFALTTFTIEAMVKADSFNTDTNSIIVRRVVGTAGETLVNYELGLTPDGKPYVAFSDKLGNRSGKTLTAASAIELNTWTHLAISFNETESLMILYVDGVEAARALASSLPTISGPSRVFTRAGECFNGGIDDIRVWKSVRTAQEIQSNMDSTLSGDETNLVANYRFDDVNLEKRAALAGEEDEALRENRMLCPSYFYCADSVKSSACDWRTEWQNVAVLKGAATVNEDEDHPSSFEVGVYAYSNGLENTLEAGGAAYLAAEDSGFSSDILQAVILSYPASSADGELSYKYFWLKSDADGFDCEEELTYASDALYRVEDGTALTDRVILGNGSEFDLAAAQDKLSVGDYIQLVVAAVNPDGLTSVLSGSEVVRVAAASQENCIPKSLTILTPGESGESGLLAGNALVVKVKNENAFAGTAHISWYRNMILCKTGTKQIDAGEESTLEMTDTAKVVDGDVWSFKVWFEREDSAARSRTTPEAWRYMQIGEGFAEELTSDGKTVHAVPSAPAKVVITPEDPDPNNTLIATASGSACEYPFNYYYQWYYKATTSSSYVLASGQNLCYWEPAVADISDDMGTTSSGFSTYVLDPGDKLYCCVYAMNVYCEKSKAVVSNVVTINEDTSTKFFENNDNWEFARPIYAKTTWMDTTDANIQEHTFDSAYDQDWVWFVVPAGTDARRMLVSFETNAGTMYNHGVTRDSTGPDTAIELYKWNSATNKIKHIDSYLDFSSDDASGDSTCCARFVNEPLEAGVYYVNVWNQSHSTSNTGISYFMHLYMERELSNGEGISWDAAAGQSIVELTPEAASASDDLQANLNAFAYDADDEKVTSYRYLWYRNGIVVPLNGVVTVEEYETSLYILKQAVAVEYDGSMTSEQIKEKTSIPADMIEEGDSWYCVVFPYSEKYGYGTGITSNIVTVGSASWKMELTTRKTYRTGATVAAGTESVTLAWAQYATFGFDATYDVAAPELTTPVAGEGRQPLAQGTLYSAGLTSEYPYLSTDVRPYGSTSTWFVIAEMGDATSDTITEFALSWGETTLPASSASGISITQMRKRVDGYYEAVLGTSTDVVLGTAGEIVLNSTQLNALQQDENGQKYAIFRVTIGAPDSMQEITLVPGWNMVAFSMTPMNSDVDDIFSLNGSKLYSGSVWQFEGGRYVAAKNIVATKGYWLYAKVKANTTVRVYGTAEADVISLSAGWNIIGPVYDIADFDATYKEAYPTAYEKLSTHNVELEGSETVKRLDIYEFVDGKYEPVDEDGVYHLKVGKAYWIKATEAVDLPIVCPGEEL